MEKLKRDSISAAYTLILEKFLAKVDSLAISENDKNFLVAHYAQSVSSCATFLGLCYRAYSPEDILVARDVAKGDRPVDDLLKLVPLALTSYRKPPDIV